MPNTTNTCTSLVTNNKRIEHYASFGKWATVGQPKVAYLDQKPTSGPLFAPKPLMKIPYLK